MIRYRRNRIAGATYFFTGTLRDRRSGLLIREIESLRQAWRKAASRVPHAVIAAVAMPDHLHAVIRMRDETADSTKTCTATDSIRIEPSNAPGRPHGRQLAKGSIRRGFFWLELAVRS